MKNNCELCGGKYDFRMVQIDKYLDVTGIAFSGSKRQVNNDKGMNCYLCLMKTCL